jgi:hypothetical protein
MLSELRGFGDDQLEALAGSLVQHEAERKTAGGEPQRAERKDGLRVFAERHSHRPWNPDTTERGRCARS